jgi:hypothetical protein
VISVTTSDTKLGEYTVTEERSAERPCSLRSSHPARPFRARIAEFVVGRFGRCAYSGDFSPRSCDPLSSLSEPRSRIGDWFSCPPLRASTRNEPIVPLRKAIVCDPDHFLWITRGNKGRPPWINRGNKAQRAGSRMLLSAIRYPLSAIRYPLSARLPIPVPEPGLATPQTPGPTASESKDATHRKTS